MKIVILDDYQDAVRKLECFSLLSGHNVKVFNNTVKGVGQLTSRIGDAEILVLIRERTAITAQLIHKLPGLKIISQTGQVGNHIDVDACTARGIAVLQGADPLTAPAELTWALIMAAQRRIPQYIASLKYGTWQQSGLKSSGMPANFGLGQVLRGQTLGVWGYGKIGKQVAHFAKAFEMEVIIWGRDDSCTAAANDGFKIAASREALFTNSDVLSLHLRLNKETHDIVKLSDLLQMKSTALFVNTSHPKLIGENALIAALNRGNPGMAAIDVFDSEPILQGNPLLRLENCICTPHIGYVERESYAVYFRSAFQHIIDFLNGNHTSLVNPNILPDRKLGSVDHGIGN
ncbi:D-2-hydroxyacid dehydrogenase family protein [Candidatus Pandoraea novymonadis]|uniref:Hydroxypyruvate reductase n=1 Tax=Candidatus Pandoraea novymonadis TaxID=1808959 RepID=A0ABX5FI89_9BURK|nr:D-2-hydroxyacid dehydrogenase family protein [Candidatus Pandoraea novymonadis]PSB92447.1 Hydroxypyruvate reductase [Candidatus Pandoraea novymonadis]